MRIRTNVKTLRAMLNIAAAKDARAMLNGVVVEPETGLLIVTDGHHMAIGKPDPDYQAAERAPFIVHRDAIAAALKGGKPDAEVAITDDMLERDGATFPATRIDARPIDWRTVVPRGEPSGVAANYQPRLLANLAALFLAFHGKALCYPEVQHNGPGVALVTTPAVDCAFGVIMPFRVQDSAPNSLYVEVSNSAY